MRKQSEDRPVTKEKSIREKIRDRRPMTADERKLLHHDKKRHERVSVSSSKKYKRILYPKNFEEVSKEVQTTMKGNDQVLHTEDDHLGE